jgi:hypothetical protein
MYGKLYFSMKNLTVLLFMPVLTISAQGFCADRSSGDTALSAAAVSFKEDFSAFADQECSLSVKRFSSALTDVFSARGQPYGPRVSGDYVSSGVPFESRLMEDIPQADSSRVKLISGSSRRFYPGASGFLSATGIKVSLPAAISPVGEKKAAQILRFEDALGLARSNSPQIKATRSSLSAALARRRETGRDVLPQVYLEGSQDKGRILENVHFKEKRYGVSLQHALYASGGKMAAWRQAGNQYQVADLRRTKEYQDLHLRIAQSYYELVKTLMVFRLQQMLLEEIDRDMAVEEEKFARGLITEEEIMGLRGRRDTCAFQVIASDKEVTLARYKLAQSMGIAEDDLARIGSPSSEIDVGPQASRISLDDVIEAAFRKRPELGMARLMVDVGKDEKLIAAAKDASRVDVNGFYGKSASYYITERERYKEDWNVMVKFTKTFGSSSLDYDYTKDKTSPKLGQSDRTGTDRHELKLGLWVRMRS